MNHFKLFILFLGIILSFKSKTSMANSIDHWSEDIEPVNHQMTQIWSHLTFNHWEVDPQVLRDLVPSQLEIDTFDGKAYVGIITLQMSGGYANYFNLPLFTPFHQLNVRTYVKYKGVKGVYFFSIDANNVLATTAAKLLFALPYRLSNMSYTHSNGHSMTLKRSKGIKPLLFHNNVKNDENVKYYRPGTIENFFTERMRYYAVKKNQCVYKGEIWHKPWPIEKASGTVYFNNLLNEHGLEINSAPNYIHYVKEIEVFLWSLQKVGCS